MVLVFNPKVFEKKMIDYFEVTNKQPNILKIGKNHAEVRHLI